MMTEEQEKSLLADADTIAQIVKTTDTDYRGKLFRLVAEKLSTNTQYYTAYLFRSIAIEYGEPPV